MRLDSTSLANHGFLNSGPVETLFKKLIYMLPRKTYRCTYVYVHQLLAKITLAPWFGFCKQQNTHVHVVTAGMPADLCDGISSNYIPK